MNNGRIYVGVDGSPSSQQALRWAAGQADLTGGEVHAVIAWSFPDVYAWGTVIDEIDWAQKTTAEKRRPIRYSATQRCPATFSARAFNHGPAGP